MSTCSASSTTARAGLAFPVLAVAWFVLSLAIVPVPAVARGSDSDSGQVRRIRIDDSGVHIDREEAVRVGRDTHRDVDIIRHDDDSSGVTVRVRGIHAGGLIEVDDEENVVRVFDDAYVGPDENLSGDVVAVFGSVEVEGKVQGHVVAVMGSVRLGENAEVGGDVVSVGGGLDQATSSIVHGESVSVGLVPPLFGVPALPVLIATVVGGWIGSMLFGWLFSTLFPTRFMRVAATASRRTGVALLIGLLSMPAAMVAMVLLFVTVIGIPLALLLPLVHGVLAFAGQLAATYLLGLRLTGRRLGDRGGPLLPMAAGTLLVAAFFVASALLFTIPGLARPAGLFFGLLGVLLLAGLTAIGCGAFLLSRFGAEPRDVTWGTTDPMPAPPPALSFTGAPSTNVPS